jgi:predicted dehydrogenase
MATPFDSSGQIVVPSRRQFLHGASTLIAGGAALGANLQIARSAHPGGDDEIKIAVVGCGGRGSQAALQALQTQGKVTLWAMADAFEDRLTSSLRGLETYVERGQKKGEPLFADSKVDVPPERQFVGFDAYQKCIDAGADLVILATPPGFRPLHFEYAVKAGKHVFAEKPVAVDAPGIRRFLAANDEAKNKNLMVAIGLQRHHDPRYVEVVKRVRDGAIGDVLFTRVYWNGGLLWVRTRQPGQSEMEYQMRNWYYFNWICGDHIVEQHIHNIDVSNWLLGMIPDEAQGMGGRQVRVGKDSGQIFDHHAVEFTYPDGRKMFSQCRHMNDCATSVSEFAHGTKGVADLSAARITASDGTTWESTAPQIDAWQQEHHDLFAALRKGEIYNEGEYGAHATMSAILGRMATYSGKVVKWADALASDHDLSPARYDFAADPPVMPDAQGNYPIPVPGKTPALEA